MEIKKTIINDKTIYYEFEPDADYNIEEVSVQGKIADAVGAFETALETIETITKETVKKVRKFDQGIAPDEFEFQFGIKLNGEYGAVLTKAGGEAQLSIKMTFRHKKITK